MTASPSSPRATGPSVRGRLRPRYQESSGRLNPDRPTRHVLRPPGDSRGLAPSHVGDTSAAPRRPSSHRTRSATAYEPPGSGCRSRPESVAVEAVSPAPGRHRCRTACRHPSTGRSRDLLHGLEPQVVVDSAVGEHDAAAKIGKARITGRREATGCEETRVELQDQRWEGDREGGSRHGFRHEKVRGRRRAELCPAAPPGCLPRPTGRSTARPVPLRASGRARYTPAALERCRQGAEVTPPG